LIARYRSLRFSLLPADFVAFGETKSVFHQAAPQLGGAKIGGGRVQEAVVESRETRTHYN